MPIRSFIVIILTFAVGAQAQLTRHTIDVDGLERSYTHLN